MNLRIFIFLLILSKFNFNLIEKSSSNKITLKTFQNKLIPLKKILKEKLNDLGLVNVDKKQKHVYLVKRTLDKPSSVPSSYKSFLSLQFSQTASYQFCGETLYYAVEYYCVYIKGTSVYVPDNDFESTNVIYDDKKSKRDTPSVNENNNNNNNSGINFFKN